MCENEMNTAPASLDALNANIVQSLGEMSEGALRALRAQLGLYMREGLLAACATYYRDARRDPTTTELKLLDLCVRAYDRENTGDLMLTSLTCPHAATSRMMAELIDALRDTRGRTPIPTLRHALTVGAHEAPLIDQTTGLSAALMSDLDYGMLIPEGHRPVRSLCIGETELRLVLSEPMAAYADRVPATGMLVGYIPQPQKESEHARLSHLWEQDTTRRALCTVRPVPAGGLLSALSRFSKGCHAELPILYRPLGTSNAFDTVAKAAGYLVVADESNMRTLMERMRSAGGDIYVFARLTCDGKLTLTERKARLLSLPLTFIRSLSRARAVALELDPRPHPTVPPCPQETRVCAPNSWERIEVRAPSEPISTHGLLVLHTTLPLKQQLSPVDLQAAVMRTALELVAAGGDADSLTAAIALSVAEGDSPCALWSATLGWHRVMREWNLPASAPTVITTADENGTVTVCLMARARHMPDSRDTTHSCLRLFAVAKDNDAATELPDAQQLRAMLAHVSRSLGIGHMVGLRPLWNRTLGEVVTTVKDVTLAPEFDDTDAKEERVFGLLVRSDETLTEGVLLGTLAPAEQEESNASPAHCLIPTPSEYSLVHRPHPTVLLPLLPTVEEPHGLIAHLKRGGAEVRVLPTALTHEGCTALADAVAGADIIMLNGDADGIQAMLSHRRVHYALESRMEKHASLVAINGAATALSDSGFAEHLAKASSPDLALRLTLAPEGLERPLLDRLLAYYR